MDIELLKRMMDAFYQAKRIRDMLPPLPEGVTSSYIQYLDVIHSLTGKGEELHQKYNEQYFHALASCVKGISEEDALCMIRTIEKFYTIMCERRISIDK